MPGARKLSALAVGGLALLAAGLLGCRGAEVEADAGCLACHRGIERASSTHDGCVSCHGGNPEGKTKEAAHEGIYGIANRSFAGRWELGCKPCHRHQVERVDSSQMFTNTGMIGQIRLDNLSGELYRKFCSRCHIARHSDSRESNGHPAGCAACHFPFGEGAVYRGGDPTMRGKTPYGATHAMQGLPPMEACLACHQRSGRHSLSYQGLMDGNNGLVPTRGGMPGPLRASDGRNLTHIAPDVHFLAGMECIDCHTSREVMGEGYAAADMRAQLEVRCEDCHGATETASDRPRSRPWPARAIRRFASPAGTPAPCGPGRGSR